MFTQRSPVRVRLLVVYGAIALVVLLISLAVTAWSLIARFDSIEARQTAQQATQTLRALEADLNELAITTRDSAERGTIQRFVASGDRSSLGDSFSLASLAAKELDVVAIMSASGELLYSVRVDAADHELHEGLPASLTEQIRKLLPIADELRQRSSLQRLLNDRGQLLAFAMQKVAGSEQQPVTGALLFFGRIIEADEVARLRDVSRLPAVLHSTATAAATDAHATQDGLTLVKFWDAERLTGYARLTDWQGQLMGVISFDTGREIGGAGRRSTVWLIGMVVTLLLLTTGMLVFLSRRIHLNWRERLALEQRHQQILGGLGEIIALIDPVDGRILETNDAWQRVLGYTREKVLTQTFTEVFVDLTTEELRAVPASGGCRECQLRASDERSIDAEINLSIVEEQGRRLVCIAARDISRRRRAEQELRENQTRLAHIVEHDALTGLPNRQFLLARLPQLLSRISTDERGLALLYVDIDHFKNINDSGSHGLGDQLLKIIARRLQEHVAAEDIVLHLGGDEFLVIAVMASPASHDALARGERLLTALRTPIVYDTRTFSLTASIGIVVYPSDGTNGETLLKHADIALHKAKEYGRDCCRAFASDMNAQVLERVALEQALRRAIDTEQIFVEYQPVVDLQSGRLVSFEALARWLHPELGRISPARFIPVAEKTGLLVPLGQHIVHNVIMQLREWRDAGLVLTPVAINVAPVQMERTDFAAFVHETARHYGIEPQLLSFEVTESALLQDSARCIVAIEALRKAGSRVYIDDFGTGFSNLSYLKTLPVDAVKIDQSFVRAIETDANDAAIVASVVAVSRQLRLDTIAEGIETAAQAARVRELGCMYGQGYFFSKPLPAPYCRALLEQLGTLGRLTDTVRQRAFHKAAGG